MGTAAFHPSEQLWGESLDHFLGKDKTEHQYPTLQ